MSEHQQFLQEKNLVDQYMNSGYKVINIIENLSGMYIELESSKNEEKNTISVLLTTPDARKYVSTKLFYSL